MKKLIVVFILFAIFNFLLGPALAKESENTDTHQLIVLGIEYCKKAGSVWSDYKAHEYCTEALKIFHRVFKDDRLTKQELVEVYINQGACYGLMRYYRKAADSFTEALKIDSNNVMALFNRAINYANLKKIEEAVDDLQKVIELDSQGQFAKKANKLLDMLFF